MYFGEVIIIVDVCTNRITAEGAECFDFVAFAALVRAEIRDRSMNFSEHTNEMMKFNIYIQLWL